MRFVPPRPPKKKRIEVLCTSRLEVISNSSHITLFIIMSHILDYVTLYTESTIYKQLLVLIHECKTIYLSTQFSLPPSIFTNFLYFLSIEEVKYPSFMWLSWNLQINLLLSTFTQFFVLTFLSHRFDPCIHPNMLITLKFLPEFIILYFSEKEVQGHRTGIYQLLQMKKKFNYSLKYLFL